MAAGLAVYVTFYAVYFVRNPAAAVMLLLGVGVAAWIRRRNRADDATFPTLTVPNALPLAHRDAARSEEGLRVLSLWLLYVRALSELAIRHNARHLPEEVATRSVLLARMRDLGLLESLQAEERDLHYLPDGSWPEAVTISTVGRSAELEALLWSAGEVKSLTPIEDLDSVRTVDLPGPDRLCAPKALEWRDQNEIRTESYAAYVAWLRVFAEMRHRGFDDPFLQDADLIKASAQVTSDVGDENRDLVLGTELITHCEEKQLRIAHEQLAMRFSALRGVIDDGTDAEMLSDRAEGLPH